MATSSRLLGRNMALYLDGSARDTLLTASSVLFGYNPPASPNVLYGQHGTVGTSRSSMTGAYWLTTAVVKDAVETLATKNVPKLGETYVAFIHPHQSRRLRDDPEFIEQTKYAAPGNFMLGEIGRLNDVTFIETTQVKAIAGAGGSGTTVYQSIFMGDNAFGHAVSLPVELRDGGILDFGREHALAWYAIWGFGLITDQAVVIAETN
jgi:N4-gp56 family major capsid protein